eukprot:CAMPEP_0195068274 /NCGR_PEP_ID=MMETSP0448-20130528/13066_1 /TAXON_ID=66468 /ORGANISM="Heterocapsa triquestra, Strain CCMP 448" /LENGTH=85 /DNA_ID=CAMNT_0040099799 /DNA_START=423 /DNA_END=677 /DNA_ORIENTATION=+
MPHTEFYLPALDVGIRIPGGPRLCLAFAPALHAVLLTMRSTTRVASSAWSWLLAPLALLLTPLTLSTQSKRRCSSMSATLCFSAS